MHDITPVYGRQGYTSVFAERVKQAQNKRGEVKYEAAAGRL
jgi:hypothetical protein